MSKEKMGVEDEEEQEDEDMRRAGIKMPVMVETECESVWAYVVESKAP